MSDEQKAISSLNNLLESCTAALSVLSDRLQSDEDYTNATFTTLRTDFLSILAIIYAATTKVALSLKPSSPQHKASLVPLKDLHNNVAALVHSIRLMRPKEGATIVAEYEAIALGVISAIKSLAQTLIQGEENGTTSQEYLIRTGEVQELIDNVRKSNGLSLDNRDAVRRLWQQGHDSLEDGYQEIQEICKPSADKDEEGQDVFDDGWDELGLGPDQKLSTVELDRAKKVQTMIKLVNLLHKRVIKDILSSGSFQLDNLSLDKLAMLSTRLLAGSDEVISSMYAPQQLSGVKLCLDNFWDTTKDIRATIFPHPDSSLPEQLENLSISTDDKIKKWFNTCFDQIDKTANTIIDALHDENEQDS